MATVTTEEITITLKRQEAFYLTEALFAYEQGNIKRGSTPYLPKLLLELQRACNLNFSKEVTAACMKAVEK